MSKIGLIDADLMWGEHANGRRYGKKKSDIFPNLATMKISAWHKANDDDVEWYNSMDGDYDKIYISKVFSSTPMNREIFRAKEVIFGGSGWYINLVDGKEVWQRPTYLDKKVQIDSIQKEPWESEWKFQNVLPYDVEHIMPDYSLYPTFNDTAMGFLSRGCPRGCGPCHVAAKEGRHAYKVANLSEWWNGQKNIVLCDPNILACKNWKDLLGQLADSGAKVDINQGLDARLMTKGKAMALDKIKLSTLHFAWDRYEDKDRVLKGLQLFKEYYSKKLDKSHAAQVFVLTNYDTTEKQDLERIYTLRDMGFEPYVMVYNKQNAAPFYKSLQRWVNMRAIFHKIDRFEDYNSKLAKE